jgi:hypothetical protein
MSLLRVAVMFWLGFLTWGLALGRSVAWDARHTGWLTFVIFLDELAGIGTGVFLARSGTWLEAVSVALGGAAAAAVVMMFKRKG